MKMFIYIVGYALEYLKCGFKWSHNYVLQQLSVVAHAINILVWEIVMNVKYETK